MKTLDEFYNDTKQDLTIEESELDRESLRTPYLYDKYLKMYQKTKLHLREVEQKYNEIRLEKHRYYSGNADPEVYKKSPFGIKVVKQDLELYLNADPDLAKATDLVEYVSAIKDFLEKTLKNVENRNWNIKNAIEWRKFLSGVT
jgi:hypothetical protein